MSEQNEPLPEPGTVLVDITDGSRVGVFRGAAGPYWSLRPPCGGAEWEAEPGTLREATPAERLRAENARKNARSEGKLL